VPQVRYDALEYNFYPDLTYWRREKFRTDGQLHDAFEGSPPENWTCNACGGSLVLTSSEVPGALGVLSGSGIPLCTHEGCPTSGWDRVLPTHRPKRRPPAAKRAPKKA
jgi:hypothetical protein